MARAGAEAAQRRFFSLASEPTAVRNDLVRFPTTYHFHSGDERASLPANARPLLGIAEEGAGESNPPAVRPSAAELRGAIDDFSATIASRSREPALPS